MKCIDVGVENAEKRAFHERTVGLWQRELSGVLDDLEDMIDDWELGQISHISFQFEIGKQAKEIYTRMERIERRMNKLNLTNSAIQQQLGSKSSQTGPGTDKDTPVGVEFKKAAKHLVKLITTEQESQKQHHPVIIAIVGMPGIGKTTLAQKIFNDQAIKRNFEKKMWVCVTKEFNDIALLKETLRGAIGSSGELQSKGELQKAIGKALSERKFFLALDDVWDSTVLELFGTYLVNGVTGNYILVTTRDQRIAKSMGASKIHKMLLLSTEDAWLLLKTSVFSKGESESEVRAFRDLGIRITERCGHLPLAIKAIGGVLRRKDKSPNEWRRILENEAWSRDMGYNKNDSSDNVMNALYLSYEDLSSRLKQCFVYLSLFPDYHEFQKFWLVEFWIADGLLEGMVSDDHLISELAEEFFEELVDRNLLQEDPQNKVGYRMYRNLLQEDPQNKVGYRMHDLLVHFGRELGKEENYCGERNSIVKSTIRRLCLIKQNANSDYDYLKDHNKLRTLMIRMSPKMVEISKDVCNTLRYLRVLTLIDTEITALPDSISNLIHLRLLGLSHTPIIAVPEAVGDLQNLQVLALIACESLETLPQRCSMLQNLRTLYFSDTKVSRMPKGVRELKRVQKLTWIEEKKIEGSEPTGSTMDELGSLELLRYLCIQGIERIKVVAEARMAALHRKSLLKDMHLHCKVPSEVGESDIDNIQEVFEELQPPFCLEKLYFGGFFGRKWPNWMLSSVASFHSLKKLWISNLPHCSELPALGELRQLIQLEIWNAPTVRKIGVEFFMAKEEVRNARPFPKLERLELSEMSNLIECNWDGVSGENGQHAPFPRLKKLIFKYCPKLKSLWNCLRHATSLTYLRINYLSNLQGLPDLPALKELLIIDCSALKHVGHFNVLEEIYLKGEAVDALPSWLRSLTATASPSSKSIQKLTVGANDSHLNHLIRRLHPDLIGLDWPVIENIPYVNAYGVYGSVADGFFEYTKSPFSIRWGLRDGEAWTAGRRRLVGAIPQNTSGAVTRPWDSLLLSETYPENMHSDWYLKIPLGFHAHLPITDVDGKKRIVCVDQPYTTESGFISYTDSHRHIPRITSAGEPGVTCVYHPCLEK